MKDLILFGMQGSGKGTQGSILARKYGYQVFDTGSALRSIAAENNGLGHKVKEIINQGVLVPTEIVMEVLESFIRKSEPESIFIFDGIPRSEEQKVQFEAIMNKVQRMPIALYIDIPRDEGEKRLLMRKICKQCNAIFGENYHEKVCHNCGGEIYVRKDDNYKAIKQRIDIFFEETALVLKYYQKQKRLIEVNGAQTVDEVTKEIERKIF
jgi:adenylate kinase